MPRRGAIFGSIKSFFKVSRDGCKNKEEPFPVVTALANDSDNITTTFTPESGHCLCETFSTVSSSANGRNTSSVPLKGIHRRLFSRSFFPPRSPLSTSEMAICHSISDPFENPSITKHAAAPQDSSGRPIRVDGSRHPAKSSRLIMATGVAEGSIPSSADTTPYATYDNSRRCLSLDIPAIVISSPAYHRSRLLQQSVLASVDTIPNVHSPEIRSQNVLTILDVLTGELPMSTATPLTSAAGAPLAQVQPQAQPQSQPISPQLKTTLLAICPGIPAAMRRRQWCVEDYEVSRRLYKGATSTVYKATCRHSGLPVALKVYFLSKVPKNVLHMIVREIKIHVDLVHKHVVMLYGAFSDEKRLVLVQEYASRGDLHGIYRSLNRRMTEAQLAHMVLAPFMQALTYLHSKGICHRDIKPENILFTNDWRLLVADFGVSIDLNQERAVTRAGTLEYMAPEVERCPLKMLPEENKEKLDLAYTTAVDIWATGVLGYELLVGFAPFVGERQLQGGAAAGYDSSNAARKVISFPAFISGQARDFISLALAEHAEERPTALQLSHHAFLATAMQQGVYHG